MHLNTCYFVHLPFSVTYYKVLHIYRCIHNFHIIKQFLVLIAHISLMSLTNEEKKQLDIINYATNTAET